MPGRNDRQKQCDRRGSVVIHDIPENTVAAGNPCRVIRRIGEKDKKYYYKDRMIDSEDLKEAKLLREGAE